MDFSTGGFNFEGLARALLGDITGFIGFLVLAGGAFWLASKAVTASQNAGTLDAAGAVKARKTARLILTVASLIAVAALTWRVVNVASVNRIPRTDADKQDVYKQMNTISTPTPKQ